MQFARYRGVLFIFCIFFFGGCGFDLRNENNNVAELTEENNTHIEKIKENETNEENTYTLFTDDVLDITFEYPRDWNIEHSDQTISISNKQEWPESFSLFIRNKQESFEEIRTFIESMDIVEGKTLNGFFDIEHEIINGISVIKGKASSAIGHVEHFYFFELSDHNLWVTFWDMRVEDVEIAKRIVYSIRTKEGEVSKPITGFQDDNRKEFQYPKYDPYKDIYVLFQNNEDKSEIFVEECYAQKIDFSYFHVGCPKDFTIEYQYGFSNKRREGYYVEMYFLSKERDVQFYLAVPMEFVFKTDYLEMKENEVVVSNDMKIRM